ncbi:MAG: ABC transporter permease subunit [Halodesulfurarchaeum sp.]
MTSVRGSRALFLYFARRFGWGLGIIWLLLTCTWLLVRLKPERGGPMGGFEPGSGSIGGGAVSAYVEFMVDIATLNWGPAVLSTWETAAPITLLYLVPALAVSSLLGILVATYAAMVPGGWIDRAVSALSNVGIGVPTFVLVEGAIAIAPQYGIVLEPFDQRQALLHPDNLVGMMIPAAMLALPLFGLIMRYARQEALAQRTAEYVKTARAKGAGRARIAAHVLRNAWLALMQVVFSEVVGLLILGTIVLEVGFQIPGLAASFFLALQEPDLGLVVTVALVVVGFGVVGTWLQDIGRLFVRPNAGE